MCLMRVSSYCTFPIIRTSLATNLRSTGDVWTSINLAVVSETTSSRGEVSIAISCGIGISCISQIGHSPGRSRTICGCIEQYHFCAFPAGDCAAISLVRALKAAGATA